MGQWLYRKCKSKRRKPLKKGIAIEHVQVSNQTSFLSQKELEEIGFCSYGTNVKISRYARIYSPEKIKIGDNVRIDDFCILSGKITVINRAAILLSAVTIRFAYVTKLFANVTNPFASTPICFTM